MLVLYGERFLRQVVKYRKVVKVWRSENRKGDTIKMNLMLNMTLDHKSPLNHGPIQQKQSASTNCRNKDSQERSLFQEMLPKVSLIATRKLK